MLIYNSLTRKQEEFEPLKPKTVDMYTCGPTVYMFQHIGNFRTFVTSDFIHRIFLFNGYKVNFIMNLTDVGHLTDDADSGEDKLEASAEKEGKSAREIADFYTDHFMRDYKKLNIKAPKKFTRATSYIQEQIDLVVELEKKGYTYKTSDGIYYDTSKFKDYGKISGLSAKNIKEGARVEVNSEKKNPTDFALWKFSPKGERRWQEWESPWGIGFPGWHIECSAMAMAELAETIDIHIGGEDHKMIHHPNERAQSEAATGKTFANYWVHGAFLRVDDGKMAKSSGNFYTISDLEAKNFAPLALRYFYMMAHYRSSLNFTWNALQSAQNALNKMYEALESFEVLTDSKNDLSSDYFDKFLDAVNSDFNLPKALSIAWELVKDATVSDGIKATTLLKFDEVLGLNLEEHIGFEVPQKVIDLAKTRMQYRSNNIWDKADELRREIEALGYVVEDVTGGSGYKLKRKI